MGLESNFFCIYKSYMKKNIKLFIEYLERLANMNNEY